MRLLIIWSNIFEECEIKLIRVFIISLLCYSGSSIFQTPGLLIDSPGTMNLKHVKFFLVHMVHYKLT